MNCSYSTAEHNASSDPLLPHSIHLTISYRFESATYSIGKIPINFRFFSCECKVKMKVSSRWGYYKRILPRQTQTAHSTYLESLTVIWTQETWILILPGHMTHLQPIPPKLILIPILGNTGIRMEFHNTSDTRGIIEYSYCCHTRLHLGFSAKLRILQVSACNIERRYDLTLTITPSHRPTHQPNHPPTAKLFLSTLCGVSTPIVPLIKKECQYCQAQA